MDGDDQPASKYRGRVVLNMQNIQFVEKGAPRQYQRNSQQGILESEVLQLEVARSIEALIKSMPGIGHIQEILILVIDTAQGKQQVSDVGTVPGTISLGGMGVNANSHLTPLNRLPHPKERSGPLVSGSQRFWHTPLALSILLLYLNNKEETITVSSLY